MMPYARSTHHLVFIMSSSEHSAPDFEEALDLYFRMKKGIKNKLTNVGRTYSCHDDRVTSESGYSNRERGEKDGRQSIAYLQWQKQRRETELNGKFAWAARLFPRDSSRWGTRRFRRGSLSTTTPLQINIQDESKKAVFIKWPHNFFCHGMQIHNDKRLDCVSLSLSLSLSRCAYINGDMKSVGGRDEESRCEWRKERKKEKWVRGKKPEKMRSLN